MNSNFKAAVALYLASYKNLSPHELRMQNARSLEVSATPDFLTRLGLASRTVTMTNAILMKMVEKHDLEPKVMVLLPELLAEAVAVYASKTEQGSFVIETSARQLVDGDLQHVIISIKPDVKNGWRVDHLVTSVHSKLSKVFSVWQSEGLMLWQRPSQPAPPPHVPKRPVLRLRGIVSVNESDGTK